MIQLFNDAPIEQAFNKVLLGIDKTISNLPEANLLNEPLDDISTRIARSYRITPLNIDFEGRTANVGMKSIKGSDFPYTYNVEKEKSYECAIIEYTFPVDGSLELLSVRPQSISLTHQAYAYLKDKQSFTIYHQTLHGNIELSDAVKEQVRSTLRPLFEQLPQVQAAINKEVEDFNASIGKYALESLQQRFDEKTRHTQQNTDINRF